MRRLLLFPDVMLIFSVELGGEGEWPDAVCLTACITVNRSGGLCDWHKTALTYSIIVCTYVSYNTQYCAGDKVEKNEMGWASGAYG